MSDDDVKVKSIETALEWTKQIITLSAGILVVSGTFIKDLFGGSYVGSNYLIASWIALCVCIVAGILFMGSLCSLLAKGRASEVALYSQPAQSLGLIHFLAFMIAIGAFAMFSLKNLRPGSASVDAAPDHTAIEVRGVKSETIRFPVDPTKNYEIQVQEGQIHLRTSDSRK